MNKLSIKDSEVTLIWQVLCTFGTSRGTLARQGTEKSCKYSRACLWSDRSFNVLTSFGEDPEAQFGKCGTGTYFPK
jgi:hypothetical protein